MPEQEQPNLQAIVVECDELRSSGELRLASVSIQARVAKCFFVILFWSFIAFLNALTPLLHLLTVPLSIAAGLYFTVKSFRAADEVVSGKANCPSCKQRFETITGRYKLPVSDLCTNCGKTVVLRLDTDSTSSTGKQTLSQ